MVNVSMISLIFAWLLTGYASFFGDELSTISVSRWGDYSAADIDSKGNLWLATEYVPNEKDKPRTLFANWGSAIAKVPLAHIC